MRSRDIVKKNAIYRTALLCWTECRRSQPHSQEQLLYTNKLKEKTLLNNNNNAEGKLLNMIHRLKPLKSKGHVWRLVGS